MENYAEDLNHNNCFWANFDSLKSYIDSKYIEYKSIGEIFKSLSNAIKIFYKNLKNLRTLNKSTDSDSTRCKGIEVFLDRIDQIADTYKTLYNEIIKISQDIEDSNSSFESKKTVLNVCEDEHKKYKNELDRLKQIKESYYSSMNKAIESFLLSKSCNMLNRNHRERDKNNKYNEAQKLREKYKKQIDIVEEARVTFMKTRGNIFAAQEEFESEFTNEFKDNLLKSIDSIQKFYNNIIFNEKDMKIINEINGEKDNKALVEKNKSYMVGPKRILFKEYSLDMNYYMKNFDCLKSKLKNKNPDEKRELQNELSIEIQKFLSGIINEEPDQINNKILDIAKNLKDNKITDEDFKYLISKFEERYDEFLNWNRKTVGDQDYKKVGSEFDDRFCYIYTFLSYFNKIRNSNKELNEKSFEYLCKVMQKILELNSKGDIDYSLCDLLVILSTTFYTIDPKNKEKKIYINEIIKDCSIIQNKVFWVDLIRFQLSKEIQNKTNEKNTLNTENLSEDKFDNSKIMKLMSALFNIMQFISDSDLFNEIVYDIFKYYNIEKKNKEMIIEMIEGQIKSENIQGLVLNKSFLLNEDNSIK